MVRPNDVMPAEVVTVVMQLELDAVDDYHNAILNSVQQKKSDVAEQVEE
jgi:hypothetical protein